MGRYCPRRTNATTIEPAPVRERWVVPLGARATRPSDLESAPVIDADQTTYVCFGSLFAVRSDGTLKWEPMPGCGGPPAIARDGTVIAPFDDALRAIADDGTTKWAAPPGTAPAIWEDGTILYAGGGFLRALFPDGATKWAADLSATGGTPVAVSNDGLVYVGATSLRPPQNHIRDFVFRLDGSMKSFVDVLRPHDTWLVAFDDDLRLPTSGARFAPGSHYPGWRYEDDQADGAYYGLAVGTTNNIFLGTRDASASHIYKIEAGNAVAPTWTSVAVSPAFSPRPLVAGSSVLAGGCVRPKATGTCPPGAPLLGDIAAVGSDGAIVFVRGDPSGAGFAVALHSWGP
jgi:hypothetical protein